MLREHINKRFCIAGALIFAFFILMGVTLGNLTSFKATKNPLLLDNGWHVIFSHDGEETEYTDISLGDFSINNVVKGDTIIMSHTFTEDELFDNAVIEYQLEHAVLEISLDDQIIDRYGEEYYNKDLMIGWGKDLYSCLMTTLARLLTFILPLMKTGKFSLRQFQA